MVLSYFTKILKTMSTFLEYSPLLRRRSNCRQFFGESRVGDDFSHWSIFGYSTNFLSGRWRLFWLLPRILRLFLSFLRLNFFYRIASCNAVKLLMQVKFIYFAHIINGLFDASRFVQACINRWSRISRLPNIFKITLTQ